jgi:hypothetical protein
VQDKINYCLDIPKKGPFVCLSLQVGTIPVAIIISQLTYSEIMGLIQGQSMVE